MRDITAHEIEAMTASELEAALHEQEQALRDLAVAQGFGPGSTAREFADWAKDKPQTRNIESLGNAIKSLRGELPRTILRKLAYLLLAFALVAAFMWAKPWV